VAACLARAWAVVDKRGLHSAEYRDEQRPAMIPFLSFHDWQVLELQLHSVDYGRTT
jgi:hypothetical protein